MPLRIAEDVIHVRITDHQIARFPSPVKVPEREEIKKPYAGEVALYYPKDVAPTQENKLLLAYRPGEAASLTFPRVCAVWNRCSNRFGPVLHVRISSWGRLS